ncbi:hypothetical protein Dimus_037718 [Dionaea muscipula]
MKNVIQDLGRETLEASWIDVYGSHDGKEVSRFATVMMRHMSYVISMKDHELPYGDWLTMVFEEFGVQLVDKKGEERSDMTILRRLSSPCASDKREWCLVGWSWRKREEEMMWLMLRKKRMRKKEEIEVEFDWESLSLMKAAVEGESGSDERFYDARVDVEEPMTRLRFARKWLLEASIRRRKQRHRESTLVSHWSNSEAVMNKLQGEFERARDDRFQGDLEKARVKMPDS